MKLTLQWARPKKPGSVSAFPVLAITRNIDSWLQRQVDRVSQDIESAAKLRNAVIIIDDLSSCETEYIPEPECHPWGQFHNCMQRHPAGFSFCLSRPSQLMNDFQIFLDDYSNICTGFAVTESYGLRAGKDYIALSLPRVFTPLCLHVYIRALLMLIPATTCQTVPVAACKIACGGRSHGGRRFPVLISSWIVETCDWRCFFCFSYQKEREKTHWNRDTVRDLCFH